MERLEAYVYGKVQMVYFRDYTRQCARELSLTGIVRNLPDGSVHVVAEGSPEALEELIERLRVGPPDARVDDVHTAWGSATGEHPGFIIAE